MRRLCSNRPALEGKRGLCGACTSSVSPQQGVMTAISKYVNDSMWEVSQREMGQGWRSGEGVMKDSPEEAILKLRPEVSWSVSRAWLKEQ